MLTLKSVVTSTSVATLSSVVTATGVVALTSSTVKLSENDDFDACDEVLQNRQCFIRYVAKLTLIA